MNRRPKALKWVGPRSWAFGRPPILYGYQSRAVAAALQALEGTGPRLMAGRKGALLADEVGMGKTWEALAVIALYLSRLDRWHQVALFVPPGLIPKWKSDIHEFCRKTKVHLRKGRLKMVLEAMEDSASGKSSSIYLFPTSKAGALIPTGRAPDKKLIKRFKNIDLLVLDEAHKARKKTTQLSRALQSIRAENKCPFLFLSATPFQCDSQQELIHLLHFLDLKYDEEFELEEGDTPKGEIPLHPSIVNAVKYSLKILKSKLDKLLLNGDSRTIEQEFNKLLKFIDKNFDVDVDQDGKTFGVEVGIKAQDGIDEYLRALVIRNIKKKVKESSPKFNLEPADTAMYLFGRAFLRQNAKNKDGQYEDEPTPGGKFLPNGYSRLCSAHAALNRGKRKGASIATLYRQKREHPHKKLLRKFSGKEGIGNIFSSECTHAKVRVLLERLHLNVDNTRKVIVFFNHLATISKVQHVVLKKSNGIIAKLESLPLISVKKKPVKNSKKWKKAENILVKNGMDKNLLREMFIEDESGLEEEEIQCLYEALLRGILRYRGGGHHELIIHWIDTFKKIAKDAFDRGMEINSAKLIRQRIRDFLSKPEKKQKNDKLTSQIRVRQYKIVEKFTGESCSERRTRVLEAFNAKGVPPYILLVSQIGGEGLDMQKACSYVIHHDLHWNPTVIEQRTGRVYRDKKKGAEITMEVLKYPGGYDERIAQYAEIRQSYKDFILGEKKLGDFVHAIAKGEKIVAPQLDKLNRRTKDFGWVMDLTPPHIRQ